MILPVDKLLFILATTIYVLVFTWTVRRLLKGQAPNSQWNFILLLTGCTAQSSALWLRGLQIGGCPISNTFEVLQFISWSTVLLYLLTGPAFRMSLFGTASAALATILSFAAFLLPAWDSGGSPVFHEPVNPWVEGHAAMALFSYGVFGLLSVASILFLLQHFSLKAKHYPNVFRLLPPILEMETVIFRLLLSSWIIYSLAIAIGAVYWLGNLSEISLFKAVVTIALWLGYTCALILRISGFLTGVRLSWAALVLFLTALFALWPVESSARSSEAAVVSFQSHA